MANIFVAWIAGNCTWATQIWSTTGTMDCVCTIAPFAVNRSTRISTIWQRIRLMCMACNRSQPLFGQRWILSWRHRLKWRSRRPQLRHHRRKSHGRNRMRRPYRYLSYNWKVYCRAKYANVVSKHRWVWKCIKWSRITFEFQIQPLQKLFGRRSNTHRMHLCTYVRCATKDSQYSRVSWCTCVTTRGSRLRPLKKSHRKWSNRNLNDCNAKCVQNCFPLNRCTKSICLRI